MEKDQKYIGVISGMNKSGIKLLFECGLYIHRYPPSSTYSKFVASALYLLLFMFHVLGITTIVVAQGEIFRISETIFYVSIILPVVIGYMTSHYKRNIVEDMFLIINNEFFVYEQEDTTMSRNIYERGHNIFIKIQKGFHALLYTCYFVWGFVGPLYMMHFGDGKEKINPRIMYDLPVPMWVPFGIGSQSAYYIYYTIQGLCGLVIIVAYPTYLSEIICFTSQLITQLQILTYSIENLENRAKLMYSKMSKPFGVPSTDSLDHHLQYENCINVLLKSNIQHHEEILRFSDMLLVFTKTVSGFILLDCIFTACNALFLFTKAPTIDANTFKFALFASVALLNFLIFCMCGTLISIESAALHESAYNSKWYDLPESTKKSIRILQINALSRPITLLAGIYPLNLDTFIELLRATYSIFNVLNYVKEK